MSRGHKCRLKKRECRKNYVLQAHSNRDTMRHYEGMVYHTLIVAYIVTKYHAEHGEILGGIL